MVVIQINISLAIIVALNTECRMAVTGQMTKREMKWIWNPHLHFDSLPRSVLERELFWKYHHNLFQTGLACFNSLLNPGIKENDGCKSWINSYVCDLMLPISAQIYLIFIPIYVTIQSVGKYSKPLITTGMMKWAARPLTSNYTERPESRFALLQPRIWRESQLVSQSSSYDWAGSWIS